MGPIENFGTSVVTVPANSGTLYKTQEVLGAGTQNPPAWDSRFSPLKTPPQNVGNSWSHGVVYLEPAFGFVHRSNWIKSQGWQQFERYDDNEPSGIMLRRDRDWFEPYGEEEVIYHLPSGGEGGGGS